MFLNPVLEKFREKFVEFCMFAEIEEGVQRFLVEKMNKNVGEHEDSVFSKGFNIDFEIDCRFADVLNHIFVKFCRGELEEEEAKSLFFKVMMGWRDVHCFLKRKKMLKQKCSDESCAL